MSKQERRVGRILVLRDRLAVLQRTLPGWTRFVSGLEHGTISAVAAALAYLPAEALGFEQSFWGAITAIAVVQTEYRTTQTTARDQFTGAAIGGAVGVGVVASTGQHLVGYMVAVVVSIVASWLLNVASAARLAGVTATIIMLVPHTGSPERMMVSRVSEVGWGVSVAIAVVWLASRIGLTKQGAAGQGARGSVGPRPVGERPESR